MIIIQTPLRVSLLGGGTDFREFFCREGGAVLSTTIDKYVFVTIKRRFDNKLRVGWTRAELVDSLDEIQHELIREALRKVGITAGVEITTMADIPTAGSGLGSSSTVTVGALHAMYSYQSRLVNEEQLAREACEIEIDILGKPIGVQDQYIAAYGGLRFMEFTDRGEVITAPVAINGRVSRLLSQNLMLFFTGVTRQSRSVLTEQKQNIEQRRPVLRQMKAIAYEGRQALLEGDVDAIGAYLHESWHLKRRLASQVSNDRIDALYTTARAAGATGGKITGAGGGGFLLLYCPVEKQESVRAALDHLQELPFQLESDGSKVIFNHRR